MNRRRMRRTVRSGVARINAIPMRYFLLVLVLASTSLVGILLAQTYGSAARLVP
jgi:hypothetical protein